MFKPLLAPRESPSSYPDFFKELRYPLLCSPKIDGIRCLVKDNICMSRTFKPLPSFQLQTQFYDITDLDGEIVEGDLTDFGVFNRTQSHVMSEDKPGDLTYHVFDYIAEDALHWPFWERLDHLSKLISGKGTRKLVSHEFVESYDELVSYEDSQLLLGYEGLIMRDPFAPYKQGRGTFKQGIIYKLKRFEDIEAMIVGFVEQNTNTNVQERDELGYAKRSSAKDGQVGAGTLGKFIVDFNGMDIAVNPGTFNHEQRKQIWDDQDFYKYKMLKFKYFSHGVKDKPRYANALGFRGENE
jgi:DNA ligase 1